MVHGAFSSMVKTIAVELAPIRFNAIHPGIIVETPAWRDKPEAWNLFCSGELCRRKGLLRKGGYSG
jgi:NAD(P)-dependent dehydrogenase (short-subunit alcohol dehydrogenase family)